MNHPHLLINPDRILQTFIYEKQLQMRIESDIYSISIFWGMRVTSDKLQQHQQSSLSVKTFYST